MVLPHRGPWLCHKGMLSFFSDQVHVTREKNVDAVIVKIEALPVVKKKVIRLRMEELG